MTAVAFAIIGFYLLSICATVAAVGRPRGPLTPGVAIGTVLISLALIVGTYWLWKL